jgi:hypothetical protein
VIYLEVVTSVPIAMPPAERREYIFRFLIDWRAGKGVYSCGFYV